MSPTAVFLSLSELRMASHPHPVFLGTSFPSHNFPEPDLQDPHSWPAQPCCSVSCYLGKLWGRIMTVGTSLPPNSIWTWSHQIRSRGQCMWRHNRKEKHDHLAFSNTRMKDFLNVSAILLPALKKQTFMLSIAYQRFRSALINEVFFKY